jgi:hypothetical protein
MLRVQSRHRSLYQFTTPTARHSRFSQPPPHQRFSRPAPPTQSPLTSAPPASVKPSPSTHQPPFTTAHLPDSLVHHQDSTVIAVQIQARHPSILQIRPVRLSPPIALLHSILRLEDTRPQPSLQHHLHHPATRRHDYCPHSQPVLSGRSRIPNHTVHIHGNSNLQSRPVCTPDSSRTRYLTHRQCRRRLPQFHNCYLHRPSASVSPTP